MTKCLALVAASVLVCAGCRSHPTPAASVSRHIDERFAGKLKEEVHPRPPATGIVGTWEKALDSGGHITLEIREHALCFLASPREDSHWILDGEFEPKSESRVEGTITKLEIDQPNMKVSVPVGKEFTLAWRREADGVLVTEYKGGGWDEKGEASFSGTYRWVSPETPLLTMRKRAAESDVDEDPRRYELITTGDSSDHMEMKQRGEDGTSWKYEERTSVYDGKVEKTISGSWPVR